MYDRILFPTDGSDVADAVLDYALDLASGWGATLHVLNVADTARDSVAQVRGRVVDVLEDEGERIVEAVADRASDRGVSVVTEVQQGDPARTIVDVADAYDVDLVVMPTHGRRGVQRLLLGSVTERVVRTATVPVLTVRPGDGDAGRYPYENVLVPTDGSEGAGVALAEGIDLASATDATLHLLHVVDTTGLGADVRSVVNRQKLEATGREILQDAVDTAAGAGVESCTETLEYGAVSKAITTYVGDNDVDVVVMGTRGRTGLDRYLLGSVAERTVRTAPVPVLTVPGPRTGDR